jgi:hypothetical protein
MEQTQKGKQSEALEEFSGFPFFRATGNCNQFSIYRRICCQHAENEFQFFHLLRNISISD